MNSHITFLFTLPEDKNNRNLVLFTVDSLIFLGSLTVQESL